jgi:hypothetical protein
MSDKIKPQHVRRKAMLYVRQSSAYQVTHNLESQRLQYAMQDRLHILGWREIDVVDDDLGRSAAGTVPRMGFDRMVAEVCLGNVGAVAAREVSRFAELVESKRSAVACRAGGAECEQHLSGSLSPRSPSLRFPSPLIGRVEDWRGAPKVRPIRGLPVSCGSASIAKP